MTIFASEIVPNNLNATIFMESFSYQELVELRTKLWNSDFALKYRLVDLIHFVMQEVPYSKLNV